MHNKEEKSSLGGLPAGSSDCFFILHSMEFSFVVFKTEVPHCSIGFCSDQVHCEAFTKSHLVACETNLDGLSVAPLSHAFNSFDSLHNSMVSSSLRYTTPSIV